MALRCCMKKLAIILAGALGLTTVTGIVGCAKKDRKDSAKLSAPANSPNPGLAQQAVAQAAAQGVQIDVQSISAPVPDQADVRVDTILYLSSSNVGSYTYPLSTFHVPTANMLNITSGTATAGALQLQVTAACANQQCNPYYLMVNVMQNGQQVIQLGLRKYFNGYDSSASNYDVYQWMPSGSFMAFTEMRSFLDGQGVAAATTNPGANSYLTTDPYFGF